MSCFIEQCKRVQPSFCVDWSDAPCDTVMLQRTGNPKQISRPRSMLCSFSYHQGSLSVSPCDPYLTICSAAMCPTCPESVREDCLSRDQCHLSDLRHLRGPTDRRSHRPPSVPTMPAHTYLSAPKLLTTASRVTGILCGRIIAVFSLTAFQSA